MVIVKSDMFDQLPSEYAEDQDFAARKSYGILSLRGGTPIQGPRSVVFGFHRARR
jgi:hypothetical protein